VRGLQKKDWWEDCKGRTGERIGLSTWYPSFRSLKIFSSSVRIASFDLRLCLVRSSGFTVAEISRSGFPIPSRAPTFTG